LLDRRERGRTTRTLLALVDSEGAIPAELVFESLSSRDGQVFIAPEQAFVRLTRGCEAVFDDVPAAVESLLTTLPDQPKRHDVRLSIQRIDLSGRDASPGSRRLLDSEEVSGPSATGAAGRGLYYAWADLVPDDGIAVLAATDRCGTLASVEHVTRKVVALAHLSWIDTIAVEEQNGNVAESSLGNRKDVHCPPDLKQLKQLVGLRSQLVQEMLGYLDDLAGEMAELADCPAPFDNVRQDMRMVEERELPAPQQPVLWDGQAAGKFPRAVILGDPGSGKTWLLIYEARRLARTAALGLRTQTVDPDDVVLPVFAELSHLGGTGRSLADKLADLAAGGYSYRFKRFLRERVTGRCVVLLDGWNEVLQSRDQLRDQIEAFARAYPLPGILLTSRIVGYDSSSPPLPNARELRLLAFEQEQVGAFVKAWYTSNADDSLDDFLEMLNLHDDLRQAAGVPRFLTAMCRTQGTRRVELYEGCLEDSLLDPTLRTTLQELAWVHLLTGERAEFSDTFLTTKVHPHLSSLEDSISPEDLVCKMLRCGIIGAGSGRSGKLSFLHSSFRDYLAAEALANRLKGHQDWETTFLDLQGQPMSPRQLVEEKARDPEWHEVLAFLAGLLDDQVPAMIEHIVGSPCVAGAAEKDAAVAGLLLAVRCTGEVKT
jgi:hypothetical protein